jgi:hypothetical protein
MKRRPRLPLRRERAAYFNRIVRGQLGHQQNLAGLFSF